MALVDVSQSISRPAPRGLILLLLWWMLCLVWINIAWRIRVQILFKPLAQPVDTGFFFFGELFVRSKQFGVNVWKDAKAVLPVGIIEDVCGGIVAAHGVAACGNVLVPLVVLPPLVVAFLPPVFSMSSPLSCLLTWPRLMLADTANP